MSCDDYQFSEGASQMDEVYITSYCLSNQIKVSIFSFWMAVFTIQALVLTYFVQKEVRVNGFCLKFIFLCVTLFDSLLFLSRQIFVLLDVGHGLIVINSLLSYLFIIATISYLVFSWLKATINILAHNNAKKGMEKKMKMSMVFCCFGLGTISLCLWVAALVVLYLKNDVDTHNLLLSVGICFIGLNAYGIDICLIVVVRSLLNSISCPSPTDNSNFTKDSVRSKLVWYAILQSVVLIGGGTTCHLMLITERVFRDQASRVFFFIFEVAFPFFGFCAMCFVAGVLIKKSSSNLSFKTTSSFFQSSGSKDILANKYTIKSSPAQVHPESCVIELKENNNIQII